MVLQTGIKRRTFLEYVAKVNGWNELYSKDE